MKTNIENRWKTSLCTVTAFSHRCWCSVKIKTVKITLRKTLKHWLSSWVINKQDRFLFIVNIWIFCLSYLICHYKSITRRHELVFLTTGYFHVHKTPLIMVKSLRHISSSRLLHNVVLKQFCCCWSGIRLRFGSGFVVWLNLRVRLRVEVVCCTFTP